MSIFLLILKILGLILIIIGLFIWMENVKEVKTIKNGFESGMIQNGLILKAEKITDKYIEENSYYKYKIKLFGINNTKNIEIELEDKKERKIDEVIFVENLGDEYQILETKKKRSLVSTSFLLIGLILLLIG